jgi:hypothetical protein
VSFDYQNIDCIDIELSGIDLENNGDSGSQLQTTNIYCQGLEGSEYTPPTAAGPVTLLFFM